MASRPEPTYLEFDANHPAAVTQAVERLLDTRDGWVNLQAIVDDASADDHDGAPNGGLGDGPRAKAGIFGWFSSKGPEIPACTWVPGAFDRNDGIKADEVGIQHAAGPRALPKLREAGIAPPEGWRQMADHPKRGLVLASTHPTTAPDVAPMVTWLILASRLLSEHGLPDTWGAAIHRR